MMLEPFLKWPGGKRWLVTKYGHLIPNDFRRYVEPFLGSGAVFFYLQPKAALLADANPDLVNAFRCVKRQHRQIELQLARLHARHDEALYYLLRESEPATRLGKAVRFIYLNRTCFNGIYRVNLQGKFNVPPGTKTKVKFEPGYLTEIASSLRNASLCVSDFEPVIEDASRGDLVYVDPPYTVMHNNNNFVKYNAHLFSWEDQLRLAKCLRRAARRGATIALCNADHESIRKLYAGFGQHHRLQRTSILAAASSKRRPTTELLILKTPR